MFRAVKRAFNEAANLYDTCQSLSSTSTHRTTGESYQGTILVFGERKIRVGSLLAEGGFSYIYKATEEHSFEQFALKRTLCLDKESFDMASTEARVLQMLPPHPNIVRCYGSQIRNLEKETKEVLLLLELCDGKSLAEILFSNNSQVEDCWSEQEIVQVFRDACSAVAHLHSQQPSLSHRDIKLENLLKSVSDNCFKLCDFGSCSSSLTQVTTRKERFEQEYILQKQSTFMYRAPEMVDLYGQQKLTEKVDIWALGCILYILCYRKHPFETGSAVQILNGKVDIPAVPSYSNALKQLILDMLQVDPNKRPSAVDVVHILQSWNGNISSCYPSYNQYTKQPGKQEMFLVAIKYITCVKVPVVESIEEDWAHFGGEEEEEPTLIHVESPVVSKRAEKHIFDLLN